MRLGSKESCRDIDHLQNESLLLLYLYFTVWTGHKKYLASTEFVTSGFSLSLRKDLKKYIVLFAWRRGRFFHNLSTKFREWRLGDMIRKDGNLTLLSIQSMSWVLSSPCRTSLRPQPPSVKSHAANSSSLTKFQSDWANSSIQRLEAHLSFQQFCFPPFFMPLLHSQGNLHNPPWGMLPL